MTDMPNKLPNLHKERTRHGAVCWYVRIGRGQRIRIHGEYGSDAFMADYHAAIAGTLLPSNGGKPEKDSRTLAWLVNQWRQSSNWANTKYETRKQRDNFLGHILKASGHVPFTQITRQHILEGRERRKATPFAANNFLKLMRALFRWAEEAGYVDHNPAAEVSSLKVKTDGFRAWTAEDVERFRKRWPLGTRERIALEVLVNTGLRRGDVVRLGPRHVKDGTISIRTEKTGIEIYIPILPALKKALDAGPTGETTFICNSKGKPWPKTSFGNWFKHACVAAKVEGSSHGLRKFAATMIAENGGSEKELQALFGWTTNVQSSIYTRAADKKRLAIQAAMKLGSSVVF